MTQDINWDTNPTDVFANLTPDPTLNRDMLPDVLANFVFDAAERMGADPALFAIAVLTVAASAIDDGFKIQPKRYDTEWQTSARLWMIALGPPGSMKTPAFNQALKPLQQAEKRIVEEDEQLLEQYKHNIEIYRSAHSRWKGELAQNPDAEPPVEPEEPSHRRLIIDELTMEGLTDVCVNNPRGVMVNVDELMGLIGSFDAYKNKTGKDQAMALALWNDGGYTSARRGNVISIPNFSASILGGIQPSKLREVASSLCSDGFLQRFFIIRVGPANRPVDRKPDMLALQNYHESLIPVRPGAPNVVGAEPSSC
jgi:hypothetical protein